MKLLKFRGPNRSIGRNGVGPVRLLRISDGRLELHAVEEDVLRRVGTVFHALVPRARLRLRAVPRSNFSGRCQL